MRKEKEISINDFSKHLFWDVDARELDFEKNKRYIIRRVLQYGFYIDWSLIKKIYGLEEIGRVSTGLRDLDKKTANFVSLMCKIPKEKFLCYTIKPLAKKHLDF